MPVDYASLKRTRENTNNLFVGAALFLSIGEYCGGLLRPLELQGKQDDQVVHGIRTYSDMEE